MSNAIALVDADSLYFRTCCVTKDTEEIKKGIDWQINNIAEQLFLPELNFAVKGKHNFRTHLDPKYKANRKPLDEDLRNALNYARAYMIQQYNATEANGMEADDVVSIWAHEAREQEIPFIVVGIDKDLLQIPGNHYNFVKKEFKFVDDDEANYLLMKQCLTGDAGDNIKGIKGVGPKTAEKILKNVPMHRRWTRVKAAWRGYKAGNPLPTRRLVELLTSWDEYEEKLNGNFYDLKQDYLGLIKDRGLLYKPEYKRQATIREPNVLETGEVNQEN